MGLLRPDWKKLFAKGAARPGIADLSLPVLTESMGPADNSAGLLPVLFGDPYSPGQGEAWVRVDREELRLYANGQTYAASLAAVTAEPFEALVPDVGLAPPLIPDELAPGAITALIPDTNLAPPLLPEGL